MSNRNGSTPPVSENAKPAAPTAHYAPATFRGQELRHDRNAAFSETVMSVAQGLELALGLVNASALARAMNAEADQGDQETPVLGVVDTDRMMRFAIASTHLLARSAEHHLELFRGGSK